VRALHGGGRSRLIYGDVAARGAERVFSLAVAKRANNGAPDEGNHEERIDVKAETSSVLAAFAKFTRGDRDRLHACFAVVSRSRVTYELRSRAIDDVATRTDIEEEPRTIAWRRARRGTLRR